jgi:hypothetical protein
MPADFRSTLGGTATADAGTTDDVSQDTGLETNVSDDGNVAGSEGDASTENDDGTDESASTTEGEEVEEAPSSFMAPNAAPFKAKGKDALGQQQKPDGVRGKIRSEERAKLAKEYEWAAGVTKEEGQVLKTMYDLGNRNPVQLVDHLIRNIAGNPVYRSQLEQYLQSLYSPEQPDADAPPQPDIPTDVSNGVPVLYSAQAQQKLNEWNKKQLMKELQSTFGPLVSNHQQQTLQSEATRYSQDAINRVSKLPGFEDHRADISKAYMAIDRPWRNMPNPDQHPDFRSERELLREAYDAVVPAKLKTAGAQRAVADIRAKAGASSVSPSSQQGGAAATLGKPKNFREALEQAAKKAR